MRRCTGTVGTFRAKCTKSQMKRRGNDRGRFRPVGWGILASPWGRTGRGEFTGIHMMCFSQRIGNSSCRSEFIESSNQAVDLLVRVVMDQPDAQKATALLQA